MFDLVVLAQLLRGLWGVVDSCGGGYSLPKWKRRSYSGDLAHGVFKGLVVRAVGHVRCAGGRGGCNHAWRCLANSGPSHCGSAAGVSRGQSNTKGEEGLGATKLMGKGFTVLTYFSNLA